MVHSTFSRRNYTPVAPSSTARGFHLTPCADIADDVNVQRARLVGTSLVIFLFFEGSTRMVTRRDIDLQQ